MLHVCYADVIQYDCADVLLERSSDDQKDGTKRSARKLNNDDVSGESNGKDEKKATPLHASEGSTVRLSTTIVFAPASAFCFVSAALGR